MGMSERALQGAPRITSRKMSFKLPESGFLPVGRLEISFDKIAEWGSPIAGDYR